MEVITLEQIEAEHTRLGSLIEQFKAQPLASEFHIAAATIPLAPGEKFAGEILKEDGTLDYYLIKLPGEGSDLTHGAARSYASNRGARLPNKREANLLRANLRDEFDDVAYWLDEEHEDNDAYAWCQGFDYGDQDYLRKYGRLRAVAVRRFIPLTI